MAATVTDFPIPDPASFVAEPLTLEEAEVTELGHLVNTINSYAQVIVTGVSTIAEAA